MKLNIRIRTFSKDKRSFRSFKSIDLSYHLVFLVRAFHFSFYINTSYNQHFLSCQIRVLVLKFLSPALLLYTRTQKFFSLLQWRIHRFFVDGLVLDFYPSYFFYWLLFFFLVIFFCICFISWLAFALLLITYKAFSVFLSRWSSYFIFFLFNLTVSIITSSHFK